MLKICRGCQMEQPISDFYRHPRMGDGHLNFCKECVKARERQRRQAQLEHIRARDRARADDPKRVEARARYRRENPTASLEAKKAWYQRNKDKTRATVQVQRALASGKLKPKPCERCGFAIGVHAHHEDYAKPLDVTWLCRRCHGQRHREINEERRRAS